MPHIALTAIPTGEDLKMSRGDTLIVTVTKLGDISGRDNLWFTVKGDLADADAQAQIQIEETGGLLYIAGVAAGTPANGSIVVTDQVRGDLTVTLAAVEAAKLATLGRWWYDIQMFDDPIVTTLLRGRALITGDATRSVD